MTTMTMCWMLFTSIGGVDMEECGLRFPLGPISEDYLDAWDEWFDANVAIYKYDLTNLNTK